MAKHKTSQSWRNAFLFLAAVALIAGALVYYTVGRLSPSSGPLPLGADGVQIARMSIDGLTYEPGEITVRQGQKVRWIIDASRAEGCARTMYSRQLGINQALKPGENVIEFTPQRTGSIPFSCTMGMARGRFQVV